MSTPNRWKPYQTPGDTLIRLARPLAILVVVAVLAAGGVILLTRHHQSAHASQPAQTAASGQPGTTASPDSSDSSGGSQQVAPTTAPAGGVTLPEGSSALDGYPVQFPHTDLGAVAMVAAIGKAQTGFDYDQAKTIADVYSSTPDHAVFEQRSHDAVAEARKEAGVPARGTVPAPASYAVTPIAFTVKKLDTDYYAVSLLSYMTVTTAKGKSADTLYSGAQLVRWVDGDWKAVTATPDEYQKQLIDQNLPPAPAAPGTKGYKAVGWIAINGGTQ